VLGALVEEVAVPPTQEAYPLGEPAVPVLAASVEPESEVPAVPAPETSVEAPEMPESLPAAEAVYPPPDMPESLPETRATPEAATAMQPPSVTLPAGVESLGRIRQDVLGQGDPAASIGRYSEALEGYKADGNVKDELAAIEALAMLSLESENYEAVLAYVDQGTALAQETANPQREGELLIILGDLQVTLGRWEGAEVAYKEAVEALKATESWPDIGLTLDKLGVLYMEQNRFDDAMSAWKEAIPALERAERSDLQSIVHGRLGDIYSEMMQWESAESYYQRALELARSTGDELAIFDQLDSLGYFMESSGRWDEAQRYYRQALHIAYQLEDEELLAQTLLSLARLLMDDTTQLHRAVQVLEAASQYAPDDSEVQRLLSRAKTRQNRLIQAGVALPQAEDSLQDYARAAVETA
jgi:tetratricopeptide (TPR) repeat protein